MRVLFVTSKSLGGSGKYIEVAARGFKNAGLECELVYFAQGDAQDQSIEEPFDVVRYLPVSPSFNPIGIIKNAAFIGKVARGGEFDIVHTHTSFGGLLGRIGMAFFARNKVKIVHTLHAFGADEFTPQPQKTLYWIIERFLDLVTDRYICPSDYMRLYGAKTRVVSPDKCRVVYNSLPLTAPPPEAQRLEASRRLRSRLNVSDNCCFLFCGRLERQKGLETLLAAFAKLLDRSFVIADLIICGSGEDEVALKRLASSLNISERVHWQGWQSDLTDYYSAADVYVMPSRWESFGLVFLEAMNYSLPIVSTETQAIPEVVEDGVIGLLSPVDFVDDLEVNMFRLFADPDLRRRMGGAGLVRSQTLFSYDSFIKSHIEVYEEVLA